VPQGGIRLSDQPALGESDESGALHLCSVHHGEDISDPLFEGRSLLEAIGAPDTSLVEFHKVDMLGPVLVDPSVDLVVPRQLNVAD